MKKIMILNGPNLNLLGKREPEIYGDETLEKINTSISSLANELGISVFFSQTNSEGDIVDHLHEADREFDGVILNPAGYTHTSVAILDAVASISVPVIEVHITNIYGREEFRRHSVTAAGAIGVISGFGSNSYHLALRAMKEHLDGE